MALILIALSLVAGVTIGMVTIESIPKGVYTYLTVLFLVMLDGLLFSYQRLQHGTHIWARLAQRILLQLAYGAFIIFFGLQAGRDLLLLAVIPLGFNVFANLIQFIPQEGPGPYRTLPLFVPSTDFRAAPQTAVRELQTVSETTPGIDGAQPITTITVSPLPE